MRLDHAVIAAVTAVITGVGGAVAVAQISDETTPRSKPPASTAPSSAPTATTAPSTSPTATAPSTSATPGDDALDDENLIGEAVYFDITGHHVKRPKQVPWLTLGPCTGDLEMGDVVGDDVTRLDGRLAGEGGRHVIEQLAETSTPNLASQAADAIVTLVQQCDAIQGGDFGYGDPVLVSSEPHHMIWYFPAFDSDQAAGGYVVFTTGARVGVVEVNDAVDEDAVRQLAQQAARIAGA
ncbi:hypothetical protein [Mumia sp. DW29H23]|uniref:hypothetical protein n=1 Tax=Mumia sp. DW29H23 TaxID=3421241 RepID=UPI003D68E5BA